MRSPHAVDYKREGKVKHPRSVQDITDTALIHIEVQRVAVPKESDAADIVPREICLKKPEVLLRNTVV